ncbi:hypothetical protein BT93_I0728 [Corymbia citriodora subsp. variegata]|nr:hypothetical protein BT93_I0728 [Corymbia citriodora subsp. variegata]
MWGRTITSLLASAARANFRYNGIDFPHHTPTGRFSNGYNTADQIGKYPPPFLALLQNQSAFLSNLLHGANFASGGAGILDPTGIERYQVQQFATVRDNITQLLGQEKSADFVAKSLFLISIGSNDILDHHLYNRTTMSLPQLMTAMQLMNLYSLGARKFGIIGVPLLGCCPTTQVENLTKSGSGCLMELNDYSQAFYSTVSALLLNLSSQLPGMIYSLGNAYYMTTTMMQDPLAFGIKNTEEACRGKGRLNAEKACFIYYRPNLCRNRKEYLFWDKYHPTEFVSKLAALTLFNGNSSFITPMNFSQLAQASP